MEDSTHGATFSVGDGQGHPVHGVLNRSGKTGASSTVTDEQIPPEDASLETRIKRLEEIMTQLEADEVPLENALKLFEEGVGHVRAAETILAETELRVEELLSDGTTAPLDPADDA